MRTYGHFERVEDFRSEVRYLRCRYCDFEVSPRQHRRVGDRSGLPRYNRALAKMTRHLHAEHRAELARDQGGAPVA